MRGLLSISLWLCASTLSVATPGRNFETVNTENGRITGHRAPQAKEVWEYLGIPYAQPPVGNLRFAAPQKYKGKGPYKAAKFGYDCPQTAATQPDFPGFTEIAPRILSFFTAAAGTERNEDCLTLNVWSKPTARSAKADKPVLVLFYGGRFAGGNTNTPFYNGKYLAEAEDLVVVTVNYRVNIFGFPGGPGTDTNLGLKDQRLAVEWVERNIAAFGGSSKKIVIAGQSSGGVAVDWYSYAYKQNPIVSGLISTSGNAFSFPMNSPERQRNNWYNVSAALGCGSTGNTVECMRKKPWQEIQAAVAKVPASTGGSPVRSTPPFFPMIDNKVIFDPRDYLSRSKRGDFAKVPYFLGHNNNEQGYYVIPAFAQGRNVTEEQAATFLLQSFVCPVSHEARSRVDARVPTWVYRYHGDWFNTRLYPTSGAYHGVDLHMIMGGSVDATGLPTSRAQRETTELIQGAIFAFVNDPKNGLNRYGWPQFNPRTKSWIDIAKDNKPKATFVEPKKYDSPCSDITMAAMEPVP